MTKIVGDVPALLTLKANWFDTLTVKQRKIMINNDVLFPATNEETPYKQLLHYWDCWRRPCTISCGIISIIPSLPVQEWFIFGTVSLKDLLVPHDLFGLFLKRQFTDNVSLLVNFLNRTTSPSLQCKASLLVWATIP